MAFEEIKIPDCFRRLTFCLRRRTIDAANDSIERFMLADSA